MKKKANRRNRINERDTLRPEYDFSAAVRSVTAARHAEGDRQLVSAYGTLWARNKQNIRRLREGDKFWGVYVLSSGSMPVYIGRGELFSRILIHHRSKSRGQFWDHFSWYAMPTRRFEVDVEALLLRMLPFYLRILNKQRTRFTDARRIREESPVADPIKLPKFAPKRKRR